MIAFENFYIPYSEDISGIQFYNSYYGREFGGVSDGYVTFPNLFLKDENFVISGLHFDGDLITFHDHIDSLSAEELEDYQQWTDNDAPPYPAQADAESVVAKWSAVAPSANYAAMAVRFADDAVTSAAIKETLWIEEWGRLAAYVAKTHAPEWGSDTALLTGFYTEGVGSISSMLEPYHDQPDVQAAYAESALFLTLSEAQKDQYIMMTLDDRFKMLFVEQSNWDSYLADNQHYSQLSNAFTNMVPSDDPDVTGDEYVVRAWGEAPAALTEIGQQLQANGVNGVQWFLDVLDEYQGQKLYADLNDDIDPIVRMYDAMMGRMPDRGGVQFWINEYKNGTSLQSIGESFANSAEFFELEGDASNESVLTALYQNVLGREPDEEGYQWWLDTMNNGESLGGVIVGFTESAEYKAASEVAVEATKVNLFGPNLRDVVNNYGDYGFEQHEAVGVSVTPELFFLY
ncbi:DUF4214 domain-containing protein [Marinobacterium arenosum]|uniref:DUF4214 domain-containing protein n=1 Tax=Marinobacterium arenosum TaxID=2862496 RepID=UPI001C956FFC|nr:DUF4214 domain-containing protein [Marinobacterium arenosum]MBY4677945.1 DUF4214 domain-containing protein [Marinobacterium arenosum]